MSRHEPLARRPTAAPEAAGAGPLLRPLSPAPRFGAHARALLFGSGVLFGLSAALARLATMRGMTGGQVTLVRFVLGLALVVALFQARPGTFRPVQRGLLVSRGLLGGIAAFLYFLSIERIPAGEATLLNNLFPIFGVAVSFVFLKERPTLHLGIALLIASAGVFLVVGGGQISLGLGWGELFGLLSAVVGGLAVTSIRALRATDNAPTIFFAFTVGGLLVSVPSGIGPWKAAMVAWLSAAGVGVAAFAAQLLMTEAYGALSVPEAALWQQLTPVASYLWALTLGERIGWATVAGVLLGIAGVLYGSLLGHRPSEIRRSQTSGR